MFAVKSFDSIPSVQTDPENIGIPRPPNLGGRDINLLSMSEQSFSPVIAGKNCVRYHVRYRPHEVYQFMFESFD